MDTNWGFGVVVECLWEPNSSLVRGVACRDSRHSEQNKADDIKCQAPACSRGRELMSTRESVIYFGRAHNPTPHHHHHHPPACTRLLRWQHNELSLAADSLSAGN